MHAFLMSSSRCLRGRPAAKESFSHFFFPSALREFILLKKQLFTPISPNQLSVQVLRGVDLLDQSPKQHKYFWFGIEYHLLFGS